MIRPSVAELERRRVLRLGLLVLALVASSPRDAFADDGGAAGEELDGGAPAEASCQALVGDDDTRAANREWRAEHIRAVEWGGAALDIAHRDSSLRTPTVRTLPGIVVDDTFVDDDHRAALVTVHEPWNELCGATTLALRRDDAIGANGRVLHVGARGLLAYLNDRLIWIPKPGERTPAFRMTWHSSFTVVVDNAPAPAKKKPAKKKPAKRKARPRR